MASVSKEHSWDGVGRIHRLRMPSYNNLPERARSLVSFRQSTPHVPVPLSEGVEVPLRYDRTHLEVAPRLVASVGEERPLPIREAVIVSLQQPAWREFFGRILNQSETPLQKPA